MPAKLKLPPMLATDHLLALRKEPQSDTNTNPRTLMASQFIQVQRLKSRFDFLRDKSAQGPAFIRRYRTFSLQAENGTKTEQLDKAFRALTEIDVFYSSENAYLAPARSAYANHLEDYVSAYCNLAHAPRHQDAFYCVQDKPIQRAAKTVVLGPG